MNIPRSAMNGPKDSVATSVTSLPKTPMNIKLNKMYNKIGIRLPRTIAFLKNFS